jgi:hypothetical protein
LGIGPLLILYPVFKLVGGDLASSVFSAHCVTLLLGWLATAMIWRLLFRSHSLLTALAAGGALFVVPFVIPNAFPESISVKWRFATSPGNSLRPIRCCIPYLVAGIHLWQIQRLEGSRLAAILSGLLTGVAAQWSNDFAIPTVGLYGAWNVASHLRQRPVLWQNLFLYAISSILAWFLLLSLATWGHPWELLKYNFLSVATDQWWYFAPYTPDSRVFDWTQLSRVITEYEYFALTVLGGVTVLACITRARQHIWLAWIGTVLVAGGVVASAGGHLGDYFGGVSFWALATTAIAILRLLTIVFEKLPSTGPDCSVLRLTSPFWFLYWWPFPQVVPALKAIFGVWPKLRQAQTASSFPNSAVICMCPFKITST